MLYEVITEGFQIVTPLHQYARLRRRADAGEEAKGNGYDEGAGAGDNQEDQRPIDPV